MMHVPVAHSPVPHADTSSSGGRLVSSTGRALPLVGTSLTADAAGGVARVIVEQRFRNPHAEPLAVTYTLPLPADGAVSGFSFRVGARRVIGEIDRRQAARERYEQALVEGRSAALLEQDRSSLFTQEIGNIPPGEEVRVEVSVDQRLRWLDEGAWEWRFPTVAAPRYLGEPGRVPDAERVTQDVADAPLPARCTMSCVVRDTLSAGKAPESPSHAIDALPAGSGLRIELRDRAGAPLDRDVVLRWAVAAPKVGLSLALGRPRLGRGYGLCTIVPPSAPGGYRAVPRDVVVLLDTSGSMSGEPLAQAVRVVSAIVDTLREDDQLELIEFSSAARHWKAEPVRVTPAARKDAIGWLGALRASGSTEMRHAIVEALAGVRPGAQRQVVLVTDGQIGFEAQVVSAICDRLPTSSRLHTVGVGSAVNRSLTGPAARAGHGVEVVIGLGEDPERAASRIVARTTAPLLVDLSVEGSALLERAPSRLPDLFAGAPALVGLALRPEGGELVVRGRTLEGTWEQRVHVAPGAEGGGSPTVTALFGRESVEDAELRLAAGGDARELDPAIERLGIDFQISTRLTSWVAVSEEQTVDPGEPLRRERMPQELPHGVSAEGMGLRAARPMAPMMARQAMSEAAYAPQERRRMPPGTEERHRRSGPFDVDATPARSAMAAPPQAHGMAGSRPAPLAGPQAPPPGESARPVGRSVLGTLRDFFTGGPDEERVLPAQPVPAAFVRSPEVRVLRGRVTLRRDRSLVVEILVERAPLTWTPAGEAKVTLADGSTFTATTDLTRSTRTGASIVAGASARLALTLPEGVALDQARSIQIALGADTLLIELA